MWSSLANHPVADSGGREIWLSRWLSVALAVALCHCFDWMWLCALTQRANLAMDALFGVYMQPLTATTIQFNGLLYQYRVSCTFADVWCGLIPLIWMRAKSIPWNLGWLVVWALALFMFNVARLSVSDVLFAHGIPWTLAHSVLGGVCYYFVWLAAKPFIMAPATAESCFPPRSP